MKSIHLIMFYLRKVIRFLDRLLSFYQYKEIDFWRKNLSFIRFLFLSNNQLEFGSYSKYQFYLRSFTSDFQVFNQVLVEKEYESVINLAALHNIPLNKMVDCGANIGLTSLFFKHIFPEIKIYAIEPNRDNYQVLEKNLKNYSDISVKNFAIWSENQELYEGSSFRDGSHWSKQYNQDADGNALYSVDGKTLAFVLEDSRFDTIDFLKIDIEGAEFEVFNSESNRRILDFVKILSMEIHTEKGNIKDMVKMLQNSGFFLFFEKESLVGIKKSLLND